jgi:hypothetical protein
MVKCQESHEDGKKCSLVSFINMSVGTHIHDNMVWTFSFLFNNFVMKEKIVFLSYFHPINQIPMTFPPTSEDIDIIIGPLPFQHPLEKYLFVISFFTLGVKVKNS